jgi:HEAT repeat protein
MKMNDVSHLRNVIADLAQSKKEPTFTQLAELSDLNRQDMEVWQSSWSTMPAERRRQIISRMVYLAEENVELNFDSIFKSSLTDPDEEVRALSIEGLWEDEETRLIRPLIEMLKNDASAKVQAAAAIALGRFALLAELGKIDSQFKVEIGQSLLTVFNDEARPIDVRRRALETVAPLSSAGVKETIMKAYQNNNFKLKVSSIYAMRMSGNPEWLPIIIKELSSSEPEMRYEAASACGELGGKAEVQSIISLTNDEDIEVRLAAIEALGKLGGAEAKAKLKKLSGDKSEAVREAARQALYEIEATTKLVPLMEFKVDDTPGE